MNTTLTRVAALVASGALFALPAQATERAVSASASAQIAMDAMPAMSMDHTFVIKAARGGNAEISMGRLALMKSSDPAVKRFARKMIADHTTAGAKLASIVTSMGGPALPTGLSNEDAAMRAQLAQLSGAAFDASYLKGQVAGHEKMEALMQKEASSGTNAALKNFAAATLPTVQAHLAMAQKDAAKKSTAQ